MRVDEVIICIGFDIGEISCKNLKTTEFILRRFPPEEKIKHFVVNSRIEENNDLEVTTLLSIGEISIESVLNKELLIAKRKILEQANKYERAANSYRFSAKLIEEEV